MTMTLPANPRDPAVLAALAAVDEAMQTLATARALLAGRTRRRAGASTESESPFARAVRQGVHPRSRPLDDLSVTVRQAAAMLGVTEEYVRRRLRSGDLTGIPFGGRTGWRLSREYVHELVAERKRGARSPRR
jgi:excisionase family DNA binding protein